LLPLAQTFVAALRLFFAALRLLFHLLQAEGKANILAAFTSACNRWKVHVKAFLLAACLLFPRDAHCFPWRKHCLLLCACFLLLCACCSIYCKPRGKQTFWLLSPRLATDGKCMLSVQVLMNTDFCQHFCAQACGSKRARKLSFKGQALLHDPWQDGTSEV
jgi:hypothetical protein